MSPGKKKSILLPSFLRATPNQARRCHSAAPSPSISQGSRAPVLWLRRCFPDMAGTRLAPVQPSWMSGVASCSSSRQPGRHPRTWRGKARLGGVPLRALASCPDFTTIKLLYLKSFCLQTLKLLLQTKQAFVVPPGLRGRLNPCWILWAPVGVCGVGGSPRCPSRVFGGCLPRLRAECSAPPSGFSPGTGDSSGAGVPALPLVCVDYID